jgi:hypothetical protein
MHFYRCWATWLTRFSRGERDPSLRLKNGFAQDDNGTLRLKNGFAQDDNGTLRLKSGSAQDDNASRRGQTSTPLTASFQ